MIPEPEQLGDLATLMRAIPSATGLDDVAVERELEVLYSVPRDAPHKVAARRALARVLRELLGDD